MNFFNQNFTKITNILKRTLVIPFVEYFVILLSFILFLSHNRLINIIVLSLVESIKNSKPTIDMSLFTNTILLIGLIGFLIIGSLIKDWLFHLGFYSPVVFSPVPNALFIKNLDFTKYLRLRRIFENKIEFNSISEINKIIDGFIDKADETTSSDLIKGCKRCREYLDEIYQRLFSLKGLIITLFIIFIMNNIFGFTGKWSFRIEVLLFCIIIIFILKLLSKYLNLYSLYMNQKIECYIFELLDTSILIKKDENDKKYIVEYEQLVNTNKLFDERIIHFKFTRNKNEINLAIELRNAFIQFIKSIFMGRK